MVEMSLKAFSLFFIGPLSFNKKGNLALLKLSNCPSTPAFQKVSHLSIKDTLNHTERYVYFKGLFDFRALSFKTEQIKKLKWLLQIFETKCPNG